VAPHGSLRGVPKAVQPPLSAVKRCTPPGITLPPNLVATLRARADRSHPSVHVQLHRQIHSGPALRDVFSFSDFPLTVSIPNHYPQL
jgi:hypothetical protein